MNGDEHDHAAGHAAASAGLGRRSVALVVAPHPDPLPASGDRGPEGGPEKRRPGEGGPGEGGRRYWRSLEERAGSPDLDAERGPEFPVGADTLEGVSRRDFVQLLGASVTLSGAAACHRPNQKIVPYVRRPPEVTPGNPLHFATAYGLEGFAFGLVVDSHAGRPTKVEGNPDHPDSLGATTAFEQALTLGLYDDNRAKQLSRRGQPLTWRALLAHLAGRAEELAKDGGAKLRFLVEPSTSPLLADLRGRILQRFPKAKFVSFSSVAPDGAAEGARLAFGRPLEARHNLSKANAILSLDADFLADGPEQVRLQREFAARRVPGEGDKAMNRLYVVEPCLTPTGTMADHRMRVRGSEVVALAQAVLAELAKMPGMEALAPLAALARAQPQVRVDARFAAAVAKDLHASRGLCLVIAGRRQPASVHALACAMNAALGNIGATVSFRAPLRHDPLCGVEPLRGLVGDIAAGLVDTLVITARNPVYGAPVDFKLEKLLPRIHETIYLGLHEDETAAAVTTFVPGAHRLESWGDLRATDGTVSLVQPLTNPLWSGTTAADLLAAFVGEGDRGAHQLLRTYWQGRAVSSGWTTADGFEGAWEGWLSKGVIDNTAVPPETGVSVDFAPLAGTVGPLLGKGPSQGASQGPLDPPRSGAGEPSSPAPTRLAAGPRGGDLEVAFAVDRKVFDGRFANNAWLQELPDPITKITWDNAVLVSQTTARNLGIKTADLVRVQIGDRAVSGPVYVQPGHADDAVTIALGYGRQGGEALARGVGFRAGLLRASDAPWYAAGATITKTGRGYRFGITQDHWSTEDREPVLAATLAELSDKRSIVNEKLEMRRRPMPAIQKPVDYSQQAYKWGMTIDLSKCSGCSACVVACASENNIPVVGRDNVRIGREMFWIRVDRYYSGFVEDPETVTQPQMCVHCETAPCEYVCPVNATVHSDEGLNEMVYNRCIGTRYCSNNCPYKARRFNFLDYHGETPAPRKMAANPDVTVRSRGVMEKCTYCVQRIERARIDARLDGREIRDGELKTACQEVCPAGAIVFGSLNDEVAQVTRLQQDARAYNLLHDLGTRPRTVYLARVRNPNPELG